MKAINLMGAMLAAAIATAGPAGAQMAGNQMDHMDNKAMDHGGMAGHAMKPGADGKKMAACNAMSHADAMKDKGCAAMMKAHPDMMNHKPAKKSM